MIKGDARFLKSRSAIVDAGIEVLLENPSAGMAEIALAAGVGRATLYRHFESREALIDALTMLCLEETDDVLEPLAEQNLSALAAILASIDLIVPLATRFRFLVSVASGKSEDQKVRKLYARQLDDLAQLIEQAKRDGDIANQHTTDWIVAMYDALLNAAWVLVQQGKLDVTTATDSFRKSFLAAVR